VKNRNVSQWTNNVTIDTYISFYDKDNGEEVDRDYEINHY